MADIRKREGKKGTTYQVRYPSKTTKSGYAFKTFSTLKEARAFVESGKVATQDSLVHPEIKTVAQATDRWLKICEKEGLNGREPVTRYTYQNYKYRADFIRQYEWDKSLHELTTPDVVAFRSWLLTQDISRDLAGKVLSTFHSVMKEMTIRGVIPHNVAVGVSIRSDSRYQQPTVIPGKADVMALLQAADALANEKNQTIAKPWQRYRPMLYLAADSGARPQEYLALARAAVEDHGVRVERAVDGSGRKISVTKTPAGRRFIELSAETLDMVRHYGNNHGIETTHDLVFPAANGQWLCRRNWQRRGFNVACKKAGLMETVEEGGETIERPKYRPYDLRHFFASMLIENNVNLKKIQTLMGHTNIETTLNVYGHLLEDEKLQRQEAGLIGTLRQNSCGESVANAL
ncbi:MAG: site-specific integrase [Hyphomonas sp.]|nr:site-specific integrase [Hyphomonas sp.]